MPVSKAVPKAVKKYVNKKLDEIIEDKAFNFSDSDGLSTTVLVTPLTLIPQNDDIGGRTGDEIKLKAMDLTYRIRPSTSAVQMTQRVITFVDLQANGAVPTVAELLTDSFPTSEFNPVNRHRFRILDDWVTGRDNGWLTQNAADTVQYKDMFRKKHIKLGHKMRFITSAANQGSQGKGAMYILALTDVATGATDPVLNVHMTIFYEDA